jgi:hypothetical protein
MGQALDDYIESKRLAAAKSNFGPLISVINWLVVDGNGERSTSGRHATVSAAVLWAATSSKR